MRRALAAVAVVLVLAGCAANDQPEATDEPTTSPSPTASPSDPAPSESPTPSPSPTEDDDTLEIEIEIEGDRVTPNGERVEATAGEPVVLEIESDRVAELHVHSSPEQFIDVKRGESRHELIIETPGVVDVEEHDTGIVILRLEVR